MDDINIDYPFCPIEFRLNCASYEVKCFECGGCTNEGNLKYIPIKRTEELSTKKHPYLLYKKKAKKDADRKAKSDNKANPTFRAKSKQVKDALKSEKKLLKSMGAKATVGSGRVFNDADGYLTVDGTKYYIEVKTRYSENASMFPTSAEYKKALDQGAKLFMVESAKGNTVTMSKQTFMELIGL